MVELWPYLGVFAPFIHPLYVLSMAVVQRVCGVPKADVTEWVKDQAARKRLTDFIRALRGLPGSEKHDPPEDG
ncbi:hypothetical protein GCM10009609_07730 [Pseudonocardia aurantiaca]|uniref:Uncharacterized protein n=1 Tax=Pseudonocardia aurantiaca TaxID=75290 RepID=A0ABW4FKC7_9PSEU